MPNDRIKVENTPKTKQEVFVNWAFPSLDREKEEIVKTAMHLANFRTDYRNEISGIHEAIEKSRVEGLSEIMWSTLENTNSFDIKLGEMDKVVDFARQAGKDSDSVEKILKSMESGLPMESPIILIKKDGTPYLISGNTRLMLARALGLKPQVVVAKL